MPKLTIRRTKNPAAHEVNPLCAAGISIQVMVDLWALDSMVIGGRHMPLLIHPTVTLILMCSILTFPALIHHMTQAHVGMVSPSAALVLY